MKSVKAVNGGHAILLPRAIAIGVIVSFLLTILLSAVSAFMISNAYIQEDAMATINIFIKVVSSFAGCIVAMFLGGQMPAIVSAITCAVYFVILICSNILFMNGEISRVGEGIICILCGGLLAVLLKLMGKKQKIAPKRRYR